jgi:hypothetical protein
METKMQVHRVSVGGEARKHQQRSSNERRQGKQPVKELSSSKLPLWATGTKFCWEFWEPV